VTDNDEPTDEELEMVARHGEGVYTRALAITRLSKRKGRHEEFLEYLNDDESEDTA